MVSRHYGRETLWCFKCMLYFLFSIICNLCSDLLAFYSIVTHLFCGNGHAVFLYMNCNVHVRRTLWLLNHLTPNSHPSNTIIIDKRQFNSSHRSIILAPYGSDLDWWHLWSGLPVLFTSCFALILKINLVSLLQSGLERSITGRWVLSTKRVSCVDCMWTFVQCGMWLWLQEI